MGYLFAVMGASVVGVIIQMGFSISKALKEYDKKTEEGEEHKIIKYNLNE